MSTTAESEHKAICAQDKDLVCIPPTTLLARVLDAVDAGVKTDDIRQHPHKYVSKGREIEIVINEGGEGLKVSPAIVSEMARRGDELAKQIQAKNKFRRYERSEQSFAYLEHVGVRPARQNKVLIDMIKEGKWRNTAGMDLAVYKVHEGEYRVLRGTDHWGTEHIEGWQELVKVMPGDASDDGEMPKVDEKGVEFKAVA